MELTTRKAFQQLCVPGGILLLLAAVLLHGGLLAIPASAIDFYYYTVFAAALLLAWRFHSSRVMFTLLTLLLAQRAMDFFGGGKIAPSGPGRIAIGPISPDRP